MIGVCPPKGYDPGMQFRIGVDGGGSKTRATLFSNACVLGEGHAGPSNPLAVGMEVAASNLTRALEQALAEGGEGGALSFKDKESVPAGFGIAGLGAGERGREARESLGSLLASRFPTLELRFFTDLEAAFAGTFEGELGILVIGGTGSSAMGFDGKDRCIRVGGFGKRLGDPGSGFSVLLEAAQLLLSRSEGLLPGGLPSWSLPFLHALSCDDPRALIPLFARDPSPQELEGGIGALEEAASKGAEEPLALLQKAGRILADHAGALAARLALPKVPVACAGGFLSKSQPVHKAFCARLEALSREQERALVYSDRHPRPEWGAAGLAVEAWPSLLNALNSH